MDYIPPKMDQAQKQSIQGQYDATMNQNPNSLANSYTSGVPQTFGNSQGLIQENRSLGYEVPDAVSKAITQKANQTYGMGLNQMAADMKRNAIQDDMAQKQKVGNLLRQEQDLNEQVRQAKLKAAQDRKAARAAALGNILGIAGGVVGAVYGGPAGAMAGYSVGNAVGNSVG